MIAFLDGTLTTKGHDSVVVNVGGIGFLVRVSSRTLDSLPRTGARVHLPTQFMIRDEAPVLFGFSDEQELDMFLDLVGVSGVGPRVALAILGFMEPQELASAIMRGDSADIARVPGVGKKTAARLCVDLSSKMERYIRDGQSVLSRDDDELVAALMSLGYSLRDAADAASSTASQADQPLEDRLKLALRTMTER
jgi:Holliday junction DNA helicase RuvA